MVIQMEVCIDSFESAEASMLLVTLMETLLMFTTGFATL